MKVLVVPDKFKGTLTAAQAADAITRGWSAVRPGDVLESLPMSDGGDGFGEIMSALLGATENSTRSTDAAHRPVEAKWWWHPPTETAIVESARVIGLAQLPPGKYHPFELDTEGLGTVLKAAAAKGAQRCVVGIGGSATNDAGFGMARALGWTFLNHHGEKIGRWTELHNLSQVRAPEHARLFKELIVAVDVQNPLLGPQGCSRVYGPQKGLRPDDFPLAERCLDELATVLRRQLQLDFANQPGAGAAGGLGFGLLSFAGARLAAGFDIFADQARLRERFGRSDLVITAEGAIDAQTLMGKGVGQIAVLCRAAGLPCIALAGTIHDRDGASAMFHQAHALLDLTTRETAMSNAAHWLERTAAAAAEQFGLQR